MYFEQFNIGIAKPSIKAKYKNMIEFQGWYRKLCNMNMSIFEWENLPETCNAWCLEYSLMMYGKACITKDDLGNLMSIPCQESNMFNVYGFTSSIIAYGFNGQTWNKTCYMPGSNNTDAEAVMIYDNPSRYPYSRYIIDAAYRLADNIRAIDVAVKKLKNPYWITCNPSQLPSVKKSLDDIDNNENAIITASALNPNDFQVLPTATNPTILNGLWDNYDNTYDVIKEVLGINNNNQADKRERLIRDEVNSNNYITDMFLQLRLNEREEFCERVNEVFGTDISVRLSDTFLAFEHQIDGYNEEWHEDGYEESAGGEEDGGNVQS